MSQTKLAVFNEEQHSSCNQSEHFEHFEHFTQVMAEVYYS